MITQASSCLVAMLATVAIAANPKRGMISDLNAATYTADMEQFISPKVTSLTWYYNFGHYPDQHFSTRYNFTMSQFGVNTTAEPDGNNFKNIKTLMADVEKYKPDHLFTYCEPTGYGVSVDEGVAAWRKYIIPIKKKFPHMPIGSPSMINGDASLPWINSFIEKCPDCHFDFVDLHYYWTYQEFQPFVESWHKRFPKKKLWVSDIGFQDYTSSGTGSQCKVGDKRCVPGIMSQIEWLDKTDYITRYTFRGEFRKTKGPAHQPLWSFLDDNGNYTPLGKWYLGVK